MSRPAPILDRLRALPLDRAPLRRAGVLAALLVALLVAGRWFGPSAAGPSVAEARRHDVQAAEAPSAPPPPPSAWTAGRFVALLLLAAGGGVAAWLHRKRSGGVEAPASALETLETHALTGGHSLRLVACGGEVLLLGVGAEGARVLRAWPRAAFDADRPAPFADVLAEHAPPRPAPPVTGGGVEVGRSDLLPSLQWSIQELFGTSGTGSPAPLRTLPRSGWGCPPARPAPTEHPPTASRPPPSREELPYQTVSQSPPPSGGGLGGGRPSDHLARVELSSSPGLPPLSPPVQEGDCVGTTPLALDLGGGVADVRALETRPALALLSEGGAALPQFARV